MIKKKTEATESKPTKPAKKVAKAKSASSSAPKRAKEVAPKKSQDQATEPTTTAPVADLSSDNSARATLRSVRISPQKARLVMDLIKGKQVEPALQMLKHSPRKGAVLINKLLRSAISNARERKGLNVDKLWITGGWVDEGPIMKRFMPRARGSADQICKRFSHITVVVSER